MKERKKKLAHHKLAHGKKKVHDQKNKKSTQAKKINDKKKWRNSK